jgi:hypothetical protein
MLRCFQRTQIRGRVTAVFLYLHAWIVALELKLGRDWLAMGGRHRFQFGPRRPIRLEAE